MERSKQTVKAFPAVKESMDKIIKTFRTDVAVIGGGPSGICAALAAARTGASTLLVEENGCSGGMATMGLVGPFMTCYDKTGETMIIKGLFEEIVNRLVQKGAAIHPSDVHSGSAFTSWITIGHEHVTPFEPETLKVILDEMLIESGVKVLYHTTFIYPEMENGTIQSVVVTSKSGSQRIQSKVFIDCTGDADVAFRSGVKCWKGNEELGIIQPASMFFRIGNVNLNLVEADISANKDNFYRKDGVNYRSFHWRVAEAKANGDWNLDRVSIGMFRGVKPDEWSINTSRIMGVDATDNESLTNGEIEGRRQVQTIFSFLRKYVPGCENAKLLSVASTLGIRESRHIQGEYTLSIDDVISGKVPKDSIFLASNSVDVHGRFGPKSNEYITVRDGNWYGVPYRCLVPIGVEGLLVAGRCVSATADAAGAIRVMPPCAASGQAAGTAAALSVIHKCSVRNLDTELLRNKLNEDGVFLNM